MQKVHKKPLLSLLSKPQKIILSLATASLLLSGCGGGGGGTTPTDTTSTQKSAYLIDSAVEGIDYTCGTLTGTTDSDGKFTYDSTKCPNGVEFKLGSLSLGTINPSAISADTYLTIQELAGTTRDNVTDGNVVKLAVLLQSLDDDNDPTNGIHITQTIKNGITLTGNLSDKTNNQISTEITARGKTEKELYLALNHLLESTKKKDNTVTTTIPDSILPSFPTFERGFSASWLEGKTLYDVYQNYLDGDNWDSIEATTMKFENGKLHIAGGISTDYILVYDYTITGNGIITYYDDVNYFNEPDFVAKHRYIHFNSYNSNGFMEVCYSSDLNNVSSCTADKKNHEVFFLDSTKATNALGNANFFDYIPDPA